MIMAIMNIRLTSYRLISEVAETAALAENDQRIYSGHLKIMGG
jgi:hypothetical protein